MAEPTGEPWVPEPPEPEGHDREALTSLEESIGEAARLAALADVKEGGVRHGAMMMGLLTRAVQARLDGMSKDELFASLTDEERDYLDLGKP
jgi:hypothetical protein